MKIRKLLEAEDEELLHEGKTRIQRKNEKQAKKDKKLRQKQQQADNQENDPTKPQSSRNIESTIEQKLNQNEPYTDIKEDISAWVDACAREKGNQ